MATNPLGFKSQWYGRDVGSTDNRSFFWVSLVKVQPTWSQWHHMHTNYKFSCIGMLKVPFTLQFPNFLSIREFLKVPFILKFLKVLFILELLKLLFILKLLKNSKDAFLCFFCLRRSWKRVRKNGSKDCFCFALPLPFLRFRLSSLRHFLNPRVLSSLHVHFYVHLEDSSSC